MRFLFFTSPVHPACFYLGNFFNLFIYIAVLSFLSGFYSESYFTEVAIEKCVITLVVLRKAVLDWSCYEAVVRILET